LVVAAMILGISGVTLADSGDDKCTVATLDGFYVFTASGFTIVSGVAQPVAIVEQIRFNGDGTVDMPGGRVSVNGAVFPTVSTGIYTVTGLAAVSLASSAPLRSCIFFVSSSDIVEQTGTQLRDGAHPRSTTHSAALALTGSARLISPGRAKGDRAGTPGRAAFRSGSGHARMTAVGAVG
jgi:hypothetical protein